MRCGVVIRQRERKEESRYSNLAFGHHGPTVGFTVPLPTSSCMPRAIFITKTYILCGSHLVRLIPSTRTSYIKSLYRNEAYFCQASRMLTIPWDEGIGEGEDEGEGAGGRADDEGVGLEDILAADETEEGVDIGVRLEYGSYGNGAKVAESVEAAEEE
ncbi:hypothetical protein M9H77_08822 [Catharanthus roseus]|uniref:Uncharacterized protein n=1 Tax=Catharanthus roseus TaxID=4058 RepID=A0ACC0BYS2_CATRO|nr:hypothetical protein M9H77_08822 [Catharanthus roseus]